MFNHQSETRGLKAMELIVGTEWRGMKELTEWIVGSDWVINF
jgi:sulfur relay (sulfurtransferase) complex TusBCD TusD component (DsrE family)